MTDNVISIMRRGRPWRSDALTKNRSREQRRKDLKLYRVEIGSDSPCFIYVAACSIVEANQKALRKYRSNRRLMKVSKPAKLAVQSVSLVADGEYFAL